MRLGADWLRKHPDVISPFVDRSFQGEDEQGRPLVTSYGLTIAGYDVRIHPEAPVFAIEPLDGVIDIGRAAYCHEGNPRGQGCSIKRTVLEIQQDGVLGPFFILPAQTQVLAVTLEKFRMPSNVAGTCVGKSTWARAGLAVNTTPLEPGWEGHLTLELFNTHAWPIRIYLRGGIAQVVFDEVTEPGKSYSGKYQNQPAAPVPPIPSWRKVADSLDEFRTASA